MVSVAIIPSSPKVKKVTNERGFIPERYAFRYGMYIVPHSIPAPRAAHTPRMEWPAGAWVEEAIASSVAPTQMNKAPTHDQGATKNSGPTAPARLTQLTKENESPKYAQQAVRIP